MRNARVFRRGESSRAVLIFAALALTSAANPALAKTIFPVICQGGVTIGKALELARPGDVIRLRGTCRESITITTDRIEIDGMGAGVIEGEGAGPIPTDFNPVVTIDGAQGVVLRRLTIQNSPGEGLLAKNGASFKLENLTAQNNAFTGIAVSANSTAELEEITSQGNLIGLDVFEGAAAVMRGSIELTNNGVIGLDSSANASMELRAAQLNASNNGQIGIGISGASMNIFAFIASQGSSITANGNGFCGIIQSHGLLVVSSPPPFLGTEINVVTVRDNGACGIFLPLGGSIVSGEQAGKFIIENNPVGIAFGENSNASISAGLQVSRNGTGMLADGAGAIRLGSIPDNPSFITDNSTTDVDLRFGSRVSFCGVTIGDLDEDDTVMNRMLTPPCLPFGP